MSQHDDIDVMSFVMLRDGQTLHHIHLDILAWTNKWGELQLLGIVKAFIFSHCQLKTKPIIL
jgi:hypothetical protein